MTAKYSSIAHRLRDFADKYDLDYEMRLNNGFPFDRTFDKGRFKLTSREDAAISPNFFVLWLDVNLDTEDEVTRLAFSVQISRVYKYDEVVLHTCNLQWKVGQTSADFEHILQFNYKAALLNIPKRIISNVAMCWRLTHLFPDILNNYLGGHEELEGVHRIVLEEYYKYMEEGWEDEYDPAGDADSEGAHFLVA